VCAYPVSPHAPLGRAPLRVRTSRPRSPRESTITEGIDERLAGSTPLHYPDYIEAVWLIEGTGQLVDRDNDTTYDLAPGTMYLLDGHERHTIIAHTQLRMYCVSNPAVPPGSD
jgi:hypothetical protein